MKTKIKIFNQQHSKDQPWGLIKVKASIVFYLKDEEFSKEDMVCDL